MKCGDKGFTTVTGQPCQQNINPRDPGCLWHSRNEHERRLLAMRGNVASRLRTALPASTLEPPFDSPESIIGWSQRMAHTALTADVDPRRLAEARGFAQLALSAQAARTQQQLVDALLRLENGGEIAGLLMRFKTGDTRPLPWKVPPALPVQEPA